jgi:hypothetical protein
MTYRVYPSIRERLATLDLSISNIRAMQGMNDDRWKQIHSEFAYIRKRWWFFPYWFWVVGLFAGGGCALYFRNLYGLIGGLIVACLSAMMYGSCAGFEEGYIDGFESGNKTGVNTVLGITSEMEKEMWEIEIRDKIGTMV